MDKNNIDSYYDILNFNSYIKENKSKSNILIIKSLLELQDYKKYLNSIIDLNKNNDILNDIIKNISDKIEQSSINLRDNLIYLEYIIDNLNDGKFKNFKENVSASTPNLFDLDYEKVKMEKEDFFNFFDDNIENSTNDNNSNEHNPELIRKKLNSAIVNLSYKKIDGTVKNTKGTLNFNFIPKENHPKNEKTLEKIIYGKFDKNIRYFDTESSCWKTFKADNLIFIN